MTEPTDAELGKLAEECGIGWGAAFDWKGTIMSNTPSLLPCPFCGGMATAKPIDSVPGWHHVTVLHSDCFYKPAQDKMLLNDEHLAAWNRRSPQPVVREPLTFGGRWLCLVCKSSTRGVHGTLDDMVTPCPEGTASSIGAHGIGSACAIAKAKQGGA